MGDVVNERSVKSVDGTHATITQLPRALRNCIKYWLGIGGRPADDIQHFAHCGLVLEGLLQFAFARLLSLEQPRVLDGDDGLVGEGLQQRNLFLSEWPHFHAANHEGPDGLAFAKEWDRKASSVALAKVKRMTFGKFF